MCKCHDRYKGEEGKAILEELAKKLKAAYNEDYIVQDSGNDTYILSEVRADKNV
ncbi:MAG TPA: hypothetical protein VFC62_04670 [Atopostipes sp.]|nr:hypothetical protein [Atopostipes sp.]